MALRILIYWLLAIKMFFLLLPWTLYKGITKPSTAVWASCLFNSWYGRFFNWMFSPEVGAFGDPNQQASVVIARNMTGGSKKNRKLFKALAKPLELFDPDHFEDL